MPFEVSTIMDRRHEFVRFARHEGANIRALCRQFGIAPNTAYKWLERYASSGDAGLADQSRRPHTSPARTTPDTEAIVLALRDQHPTWGGRKLQRRMQTLGYAAVPAPSTITAILRRHDRLQGPRVDQPRTYGRFERPTPNDLWQLDFMGHRAMGTGRIHPLSVLDDHSRFGIGLFACAHERSELVQAHLITCFQAYGLPTAILADNGPTWGSSHPGAITWLEAWWIRLGIRVLHGRYRHPQTQGKVERWHQTIDRDLFQFQVVRDLTAAQAAFNAFRHVYNTDRPHEALALDVPSDHYHPSPRSYPETLPEIVYSDDHTVHLVKRAGWIWFGGRMIFISEALRGLPVGVRPTLIDGVFVVRFCDQAIKRIDLRAHS